MDDFLKVGSAKIGDIQDRILYPLYYATQAIDIQELKKEVFNNWSGVDLNRRFVFATDELKDLGYIEANEVSIWITYKGRKFFETTVWPFSEKPFKYQRVKNYASLIWKYVKIKAAVLNALAIIFLAWYSIDIQREFNKEQIKLQKEQIESNRLEQEEKNKQVQQQISTLQEQNKSIGDIKQYNKLSNQAVLKPQFRADYISTEKIFRIDISCENISQHTAENILLQVTVHNLNNKKIAFSEKIASLFSGDYKYFSEDIIVDDHIKRREVKMIVTISFRDKVTDDVISKTYNIKGLFEKEHFQIIENPIVDDI